MTVEDSLKRKLKAMDGHELMVESQLPSLASWMCRNPKDSNAWFRVVTAPDMVCVYGDIGDRMVYRIGAGDMIPWLRGSVSSHEYLVSKIPGVKTEFDTEKVLPLFEDQMRQASEDENYDLAARYAEAIDAWKESSKEEQVAIDLLITADDDSYCDIIDGLYSPTEDVVWTVAALTKFIELIDRDE